MSKLSDLCEELIREDYYDDYERFTKGVMKLARAAQIMEKYLLELKTSYTEPRHFVTLTAQEGLSEMEKILGEEYE